MLREITQRELRNDSGQVMRALDAGESFIVTRSGVPVAELTPFRRRGFASKASVLAAFRHAAPVDFDRFRNDLDAIADQDTTPRG
jgi:prevent-host-death family protein